MYFTGIPDTKTLCDNGWLTIREIVDTVNSKISPDKITENIVRYYSTRKVIDPGIIAPAMIMIGKGRRRAKLYPTETVRIIVRVRELLVSGWTLDQIIKQILNAKDSYRRLLDQTTENSDDINLSHLGEGELRNQLRKFMNFFFIFHDELQWQNQNLVTYAKFQSLLSEVEDDQRLNIAIFANKGVSSNRPDWERSYLLKNQDSENFVYWTYSADILDAEITEPEMY